MNLADLDTRTIIALLVLGNLAQIPILFFHKPASAYSRPYWSFVVSRALQAAAWLLLGLRGGIPDWLSAYVGNVLLAVGFASEAYALTTAGTERKPWGIVYGSIAGAGSAVFCLLASTPSLWVGVASALTCLLFLPAAVALQFPSGASSTRRLVGLAYLVAALPLGFRAWNGFFAKAEFTLLSRNLVQTWAFCSVFLLMVVSGIGFLLLLKELADGELRESERRYRALSTIDALTGLYNSRFFHSQVKIDAYRAERYRQPLTLLFLDIDDFKQFNDAYGHLEGDNLLARFGQVLKEQLRQTDCAYRYGGEEFTVVMPMTTGAEGAAVGERIRTAFRNADFSPVPGKSVHRTVSIGVTQYRQGEDVRAFLDRADRNMYRAKTGGKDRVCRDDPSPPAG